jgi:hypothetical protein
MPSEPFNLCAVKDVVVMKGVIVLFPVCLEISRTESM